MKCDVLSVNFTGRLPVYVARIMVRKTMGSVSTVGSVSTMGSVNTVGNVSTMGSVNTVGNVSTMGSESTVVIVNLRGIVADARAYKQSIQKAHLGAGAPFLQDQA